MALLGVPMDCVHVVGVGLARTICLRCTYGIFGRGITIFKVIYGVYILNAVLVSPTYVFRVRNEQGPARFLLLIPGSCTYRVGQDHIYTVYIRCFWQGNHRIYGHIRCIYTIFLAGKSPYIKPYTVYIYGPGQP